jgi:hypothetical protein
MKLAGYVARMAKIEQNFSGKIWRQDTTRDTICVEGTTKLILEGTYVQKVRSEFRLSEHDHVTGSY